MKHTDYGISRAEHIDNLRADARFYRANAAALRAQASGDETSAQLAEDQANRLAAQAGTAGVA